jgi:outer membrane protein OmpA-like peptidoglycan-associated protein/Tol biopolymer transport system component
MSFRSIAFLTALFLTVFARTFAFGQDTAKMRIEKRNRPAIRKINLGPDVNSQYSELSPIISPDGKLLFFTMGQGNPDNMGDEHLQDCYVSRRTASGWSKPVNLGVPINSAGNDAISGVSPDGSVLFIKNFVYNKTSGLCFARRIRSGWKIDSITIDNYSNANALSSQCISADFKYIIFSAERPEGYGELDLYVSKLIGAATNHYGTPQNLGPVINTNKDEFAPFLAVDGQSLYFSSRGHGGYGNADVFLSKRLDDSWVNWTAPKNLGPELNTPEMDAYYSIPASGDVAYYSSYNGANQMDLYMVTLTDDIRPNPVILVTGKVINKAGAPLEASVSYSGVGDDTAAGSMLTNIITGHFALVLPSGRNYAIRVEAPGYLPYSDNIDLTNATLYRETSMTITLDSMSAGNSFVLKNIFFDFDKAILRPDSRFELERLVSLLTHYRSLTALIGGYTDSTGTPQHNEELSQARAQAVVDYLVSAGIDSGRIKAFGYGASDPVAPNATEEGKQLNRRVVFRVVGTKNE